MLQEHRITSETKSFRKAHVESERLATEGDAFDPFVAFHEWESPEDEEAFKHL
jgi:hypothetical protein